jgi:uncharacterized Zn finger protein (UPF0148 family)
MATNKSLQPASGKYKCPKCGSVIYTRSNVLCGKCGERLPKELLFVPAEREVVQQEMAELKKRAREVRKREIADSSTSDSMV